MIDKISLVMWAIATFISLFISFKAGVTVWGFIFLSFAFHSLTLFSLYRIIIKLEEGDKK